MVKVTTKVTDRDAGFRKMVGQLGEMGNVTIGVQGKEALEPHPSGDLTVGEVAAIHELGLGVPRRSWLISWFDKFEKRNLAQAAAQLQLVLQGHLHVREEVRWGGTTFLTGGAVSGAWWRGAFHGTPPGFNVITLSDDRVECEYRAYDLRT